MRTIVSSHPGTSTLIALLALAADPATGLSLTQHVDQAPTHSAVSENIFIFGDDLTQVVSYGTTRTPLDHQELWLPKGWRPDSFMYLYPHDFSFDSSQDSHNVLTIDHGDHANMYSAELLLEEVAPGEFEFRSWDGSVLPNGHFGMWHDLGFEQLAAAWVLPSNVEVLSAESNVHGIWEQRQTTLAFYGEQVNDVVFVIRFRPKVQPLMADIRDRVGDMDGATIEIDSSDLRVILEERLLFPTGRSRLTEEGRGLLETISQALRSAPGAHLVVEGHSDDVPVVGTLPDGARDNWELSSDRSVEVARTLVDLGAPPRSVEIRAFGPFKPRDSSDTELGRMRNRRVEILVQLP